LLVVALNELPDGLPDFRKVLEGIPVDGLLFEGAKEPLDGPVGLRL